MPILSGKISEFRRRIEEEKEVVNTISNSLISDYMSSLTSVSDSILQKELNRTVTKHVATLTKPFKANLKRLEKNAKHLNLKWQIKHIFGSLILSLIFVMVAHTTVKDFSYTDPLIPIDNSFWISICALVFSFLFFAYALYRIWTLICIVVNHNSDKDDYANSNTKESKIIGSDK